MERREKKRESERPPGVGRNHQADVAVMWRERPGADGPGRACAASEIEVCGEGLSVLTQLSSP